MKITKLTKLLISFMGGGKIDFPTRHLKEVEINGDGLDGGGGGQEETDEVKTYLDELATKVKSSKDYAFSYDMALNSFTPKEIIEGEDGFEDIINSFKEQGKVQGDTNNYDYIYIEHDDEQGAPSMLTFITEEQYNYFQKSIIKTSAKDFIHSSFAIDNLEQVFGGINLSGENAVKNQLAIDNEDFKFAIGRKVNEEFVYTIFDDIDVSYFITYFSLVNDKRLILFGENETRKIFDVKITPLKDNDSSNKFSYLEFATLSRYFKEDTIQINNKNYKYLKFDSNVPS